MHTLAVQPAYTEVLARLITCRPDGLRIEAPDGGRVAVVDVDDRLGEDYTTLWRFLYVHHYCCDPGMWDGDGGDALQRLGLRAADPDFLRELDRAVGGDGWWDPGWRVGAVSGGAVSGGAVPVVKSDVTLAAPRRDVRAATGGIEPGALVQVRFPTGSAGRMPAFYHVTGRAGPGAVTRRIYLNTAAGGAAATVGRVVAALDDAGIVFTLKIVSDRRGLRRRDNTVVYLADRDLDPALAAVRGAVPPGAFEPETLLFTRRVAGGISVAAEDPDPDPQAPRWSFGESRCRALARGLLLHAVEGCAGDCDIADVLRNAFRAAGLDPDRPDERPAEEAIPV